MERADQRVLSALATLQGGADWTVVKEWLIASRDADVKTMLLTKDDVALRWLQGSVQTLNSILDSSNNAMEVIHRKRTQS